MATKAKLKFRGDISYELEHKLCTRFGFKIYSRQGREWIIVEKIKPAFQLEVLVNGELPEDIQKRLLNQCNNIVNMFQDPNAHMFIIRTRLRNIMLTMPPQQKKFVEAWIDRNLQEDQ